MKEEVFTKHIQHELLLWSTDLVGRSVLKLPFQEGGESSTIGGGITCILFRIRKVCTRLNCQSLKHHLDKLETSDKSQQTHDFCNPQQRRIEIRQ